MAPKRRREVEDPNNTWNQQLMAACLRLDRAEVEALIEKGADPVKAREATPFSKGDRISPLAALLLQGNFGEDAMAMMRLLMMRGASVDDLMALPGPAHRAPGDGANEHERVPSAGPHSRRASAVEVSQASVRAIEASMGTPDAAGSVAVPNDEGTLLHYVVALGDHAHLLLILHAIGVERNGVLPHCLMREVEYGIVPLVAPDPPSAAGSRSGGRPKSGRSMSTAGRKSRQKSPDAMEGRGPRSSLPVLNALPTSSVDLRLRLEDDGKTKEVFADFSTKSSVSQMTAAELAVERGDITAARLLTFYGASIDFSRLVNGTQTALARACSNGDVQLVEKLLDAGDSMSQISADGRYTLMHYAAAQPSVLDYLIRRGLSIEAENAYGDSALISLIRFGTGRNADYATKECPRVSDSAKLCALPYCALRNYILMPLPPLMGAGSKASKAAANSGRASAKISARRESTTGVGIGEEPVRNYIGGGEVGTWWSFSSLPTSDMIQHLLDYGANIHGYVPDDELDLAYVLAAEEAESGKSGRQQHQHSRYHDDDVPEKPSSNVQPTPNMVHGRLPLRLTPLMHAILGYHPELIRKLVVDYHVNIMKRDSQGACALHYAAICPQRSVLELLLSNLVIPNTTRFDVNAADLSGRTPLHYAAAKGNATSVELILGMGASALAGKPDHRGLTPLHVAVRANEERVVELLLRHSDNVLGAASSVVTAHTALSTAKRGKLRAQRAGGGHRRASAMPSSFLAEFVTVDIEAEEEEEHLTALEMAIKYHRDPAIVKLLLSEGHASFIRGSGLYSGGTLLHRAVVDDQVSYVRQLLDFYADPNEPDEEDNTPLVLAVDKDQPNLDMIACLLSSDAWPHSQSCSTLLTPLHIAAQRGNPDVLDLLFHEVVRADARHAMGDSIGGSVNNRRGRGRRERSKDKGSSTKRWLASLEDEGMPKEDVSYLSDAVGFQPRHGSSDTSDEEASRETSKQRNAPKRARLICSAHFLLTDATGRSPLHILCSHVEPKAQERVIPFIRELLETEDIRQELCELVDIHGRTALHEACRSHFLEAVEVLLTHDPQGVFCVDAHGSSLLHDCVSFCPRSVAIARADEAAQRSEEPMTHPQVELLREQYVATALSRMEGIVQKIAHTVSRAAPWPLRGAPLVTLPLGPTAVSTQLTITAQLLKRKSQTRCWGCQPTFGQVGIASNKPAEQLIHSWVEYIAIADDQGRTPILLAGELHNTESLLAIYNVRY